MNGARRSLGDSHINRFLFKRGLIPSPILADPERITFLTSTKTTAMFSQPTVRKAAIAAIILSALGLLISLLALFVLDHISFAFFMGVVSWAILLWSSILAFKLSKYNLYEEEYKKVGWRVYAIILAFLLFFFVGLITGLVISIIILKTLWSLKSNYDEWVPSDYSITEEIKTGSNDNIAS